MFDDRNSLFDTLSSPRSSDSLAGTRYHYGKSFFYIQINLAKEDSCAITISSTNKTNMADYLYTYIIAWHGAQPDVASGT